MVSFQDVIKRQAENYGFKNIYGLIGKEDKDFLKEEITKEKCSIDQNRNAQ